MIRYTLYMFTLGLLTILSVASGFLLQDNCPAPSPCTCSGSSSSYAYIYCNGKGLTAVPTFKPTNDHVNTLYLYLYSNSIKSVPSHAFKNLSNVNASGTNIQLYSNDISSIADDAFIDFENISSVTLDLHSNNLSTIPTAVSKLKGLVYLNILDNPTKHLDGSFLSKIGMSLKTLHIDLKLFTEWPRELRNLNILKELYLKNIPFTHLDTDVFHGFENTLTSVTFDNSKLLEKIPYVVCTLPNLESITFKYSPQLKENRSSIFEHCQGHHHTVTTLYLNYDYLNIFPDIFHLFPSLKTLSLAGNALELLETEKIPSHNSLTSFDIHSNKFRRIPSAFHKLKSLTYIFIYNNEIISVEDFDLNFLKDLTYINLNNNPLRYISPNAFRGNQKLNSINLQNTQLTTITTSVLSLPKLSSFYTSGAPIDCSCDMSSLKPWNVTAINFNGLCSSSNVQLKEYLLTSLQHCP